MQNLINTNNVFGQQQYLTHLFISVVFLLFFGNASFAQNSSKAESVEYDPVENRFLVGSDDVSIIEIDSLGDFSYFGNGLDSNLGIEVMDGNLFCIVGEDLMKVYDLATETEIAELSIAGAQFLNGMTSDGVSKIWVTDFVGRAIYEIDFSDLSQPVILELANMDDIPNLPNGITYDEVNNRLVFVSWNDEVIRQLNLEDGSISIVAENIGISNMDGIDLDKENNFYVASWSPESRITKFSSDFSEREVLNIPGVQSPADICVADEINMLAIPSFQHDVIFWPLETTTSNNVVHESNGIGVDVFPNPSKGELHIQLSNQDWQDMALQLIDNGGRITNTWLFQNNQRNSLSLDLFEHPNGVYTLSVLLDGRIQGSKKIVIIK